MMFLIAKENSGSRFAFDHYVPLGCLNLEVSQSFFATHDTDNCEALFGRSSLKLGLSDVLSWLDLGYVILARLP